MTEKDMRAIGEMIENNTLHSLKDEDTFIAGCKQCGNCCRNRNDIFLNPLDIFHISQATGKTLGEVIDTYGDVFIGESSCLPLVSLKYRKDSFGNGTTCRFLGKKNDKYYCRINDKKPFVCKTYPLERLVVFQDLKREDAFAPVYREQTEYKDYHCPGIQEAIKNNQTSTVVEWVGGKEKKELADAFWRMYAKFLYDLYNVVNLEKFMEYRNPEFVSKTMKFFYITYYLDYKPSCTETEFLQQYQINTDKILNTFQKFVKKFPQYAGKKR